MKRSGKQWKIGCATSQTSVLAVKSLSRVNCRPYRRCPVAEAINRPCLICRNPQAAFRLCPVATSRHCRTCRNRPVDCHRCPGPLETSPPFRICQNHPVVAVIN